MLKSMLNKIGEARNTSVCLLTLEEAVDALSTSVAFGLIEESLMDAFHRVHSDFPYHLVAVYGRHALPKLEPLTEKYGQPLEWDSDAGNNSPYRNFARWVKVCVGFINEPPRIGDIYLFGFRNVEDAVMVRLML